MYLDGSDAPDLGPDGQPLLDDDFLVLVNGWWEPIEFTIPDCPAGAGVARRDRHFRSRAARWGFGGFRGFRGGGAAGR